ncbi:MAG: DUF1592 domain-containing protein [Archangiaceae bacterium]|nr:DUF1592 domain-containing protein [Archangiaceae bacterium]
MTSARWLALTVMLGCTGDITGAPGHSPPSSTTPPAPTGEPPPPPAVTPPPPPFDCKDPSATAASLSYTLTKAQYQNTVEDLFGAGVLTAVSAELSVLSPDTFDKVSHARTTGISSPRVEAYFKLAKAVAAWVVADPGRLRAVFGACATQASPPAGCIDTYLNGFARRVLRRPLSADELAFARQLAGRTGAYSDHLRTVLTLHLSSPSFLWVLELGKSGTADAVQLTPHEVAARIAYQTMDSTPDAALLAAADAGELATVAQVKAQVARLLQTPKGRQKVRASILRWSQQDALSSIELLPAALTAGVQTQGLAQAMLDEAGTYVEYEVYDRRASFKELLTSKASLASHPGLSAIYGHPPASPGAPATFTGRRQGLLMRAPLLASSTPRASPIHRGVAFAKLILCNDIPLPDPSIVSIRSAEAFTPDELLQHTTREAVTHQTAATVCMGCHGLINSHGFAFEGFDPLGRLRTEEQIFDPSGAPVRALPIDASTRLTLDGRAQGVSDAYDLVTAVASSTAGTACFTRHAQRFIFQRLEAPSDACRLQAVQRLVADADRPLLDAIAELISDPSIFSKPLN